MERLLAVTPAALLAFTQALLKKIWATTVSGRSDDRWGYLKALAATHGMWPTLAGAAFIAWMPLQRHRFSPSIR